MSYQIYQFYQLHEPNTFQYEAPDGRVTNGAAGGIAFGSALRVLARPAALIGAIASAYLVFSVL